jgi:hypothetical protein
MNNQFKDGVLLTLSISKWSGAKKLDPSDLGLTSDQVPDFMRLGKKLLIPKEERDIFQRLDNNARNAIERDSFAFPVGEARFVPTGRLLAVDAKLKEYRTAFQSAVESFMNRYHSIRDDMLSRYPEHRDKLEPFYPASHQILRHFSFSWMVFEIGEAGMTDGMTVEAYERFKQDLKAQFDQFLNDVVIDLRFQVQECCLHVAERVAKGEIITGNSIKSLNMIIDRFMNLNFVGDAKIESQLKTLRSTLQTTDPAALKENEILQKQLGAMAAGIAKEAAEISDVSEITGQYKRHLEMD